MPDLTIEIYFHCASAEHFSTEVKGSKGAKYTVRYGDDPSGRYQYDYTCTCHAFKFGKGKHCKHIEQVKKPGEHCGWMEMIDGGKPVKTKDGYKCPKCGKEAIAARHAV